MGSDPLNITLTRSIITPTALLRLAIGWGGFLLLSLTGHLLGSTLPAWLLLLCLLGIILVILICSFGVVHEAEQLARRMGDPYGSLVLTLSIVLIEVILISAVMLGPGEHASIAKDSVMAVSMIILNLVIGLSLLVGGIKHGTMAVNRTGTSSYLVMLGVLLMLAFALPGLISEAGSYTTAQRIPLVLLTLGLYAFFLYRQMGAQAPDFTELQPAGNAAGDGAEKSEPRTPIAQILREHRKEISLRLGLLVLTVLPIVLLSHDMASLLDLSLERVGAPVALSGILIAMIVFLPESITSVRAALAGEIQRVSNLCHGALVSTVGLTIPAVLIIGSLTDQRVILAESAANLTLLAVTMLVTVAGFGAKKLTAIHGAAHLALFVVYGLVVFS